MRVARGSIRVISDRLYSAARQSAEAITATGSVAIGLPRYLVLLGDALQSLPPRSPLARPVNGASQPPAYVEPRAASRKILKREKGGRKCFDLGAETPAVPDVARLRARPPGRRCLG